MKHCILAKWNEKVVDKAALLPPIKALFGTINTVSGLHSAQVYPCCIDRENRYDVMIVLDMDKEALPIWDASPLHRQWKDEYGTLIEKKAIFDYE